PFPIAWCDTAPSGRLRVRSCWDQRGFKLSVRLGSLAQFQRQGSIFLQIKASQNPRLALAITKAGFGTGHNAYGIWATKAVTVAAHPTTLPGRISDHKRVVWHVFRHHRARSYKRVAPDFHSADDRGIGPNSAAALEDDGLVKRMPIYLRSRIDYVC